MNGGSYPGLRAFHRDETEIFFGRETQTDELLDKLSGTHFLAVIGPSGCGKSSLVRCGLLPSLESGFMPGARGNWSIAELRPGNAPFTHLAESLIEDTALGSSEPTATKAAFMEAKLRRGPRAFHEILEHHPLPDHTCLLLLVDQFEEIFRYDQGVNKDDAYAFVSLILAAATHPDIYAVITMRSDFLGDCSRYRGLPEAVNQGIYLTPRLTRKQMAEAIRMPARVYGGDVEPKLVNRLLNDVVGEPDQLPLLQHALMRLWERDEDKILTLPEFKELGRLQEILDDHVEESYKELDPTQQKIAQVLFCCLTESGSKRRDTRRPTTLSDVAKVAATTVNEVVEVVEVFRKPDRSFLTPALGTALIEDTILDISHESLIRQWRRLHLWVKEEARSAEIYKRLGDSALLWQAKETSLLQSPELDSILAWRNKWRPTAAWARRYGSNFELSMKYLDESKAHYQETKKQQERDFKARIRAQQQRSFNKKIRLFAYLLGAVLITAIVGAGLKINNEKENALEANLELNITKLTLLAKDFLTQQTDDLALLLLLQANNLAVDDALQDRQRLSIMVLRKNSQKRKFYWGSADRINAVAFSHDGKLIASGGKERGVVRIHNTRSGTLVTKIQTYDDGISDLQFDPCGRFLASTHWNGTGQIWDTRQWKEIKQSQSQNLLATKAAFSRDCSKLATLNKEGRVTLWKLPALEKLNISIDPEHRVMATHIEFNPANSLLAIAGKMHNSDLSTVSLWDTTTGAKMGDRSESIPKHITALAFTADGNTLAVSTKDNLDNYKERIVLLDSSIPEKLPISSYLPPQHTDWVLDLEFLTTGNTLISSSRDAKIIKWDLSDPKSPKYLETLKGHSDWVWSIDVHPENQQLISGGGDKKIILWDLGGDTYLGTKLQADAGDKFWSLAFNPAGTKLAAVSKHGKVLTYNSDNHTDSYTLLPDFISGFFNPSPVLSFNSEGQLLFAGSQKNNTKTQVFRHDFNTRKTIPVVSIEDNAMIMSLSVSANSTYIAYTTAEPSRVNQGHLFVSDMATEQPPKSLNSDYSATGWGDAIAFANNSSILAFGCRKTDPDGEKDPKDNPYLVCLMDAATMTITDTLPGHQGAVFSVAFSPDDRLIASAGDDNEVIVWALSENRIYREKYRLKDHVNRINSINFNKDGSLLASAGRDNRLVVWDVATGTLVTELQGHSKGINSLLFHPNQHAIATASDDGSIRLWNIGFDTDWPTLACGITNRNLSCEEQKEYVSDTKNYQPVCPQQPIPKCS